MIKKILCLVLLVNAMLLTSHAQDIQKDSLLALQLQDSIKEQQLKRNYDSAIYYAMKAFDIYNNLQKLKKKDYYLDQKIKRKIDVAECYALAGKFDTAHYIISQLIDKEQSSLLRNKELLAGIYNARSMIYSFEMQTDSIIHYCNLGISILENNPSSSIATLFKLYYRLATLSINRGNFDTALEKLDLAMNIIDETVDIDIYTPYIYIYKAIIYTKLEDYKNAEEYYHKAFIIYNKDPAKNYNRIDFYYTNIINLHISKREFYKALEYAQKLQDLLKTKSNIKDLENSIYLNGLYGVIYGNIQQNEKAKNYYLEALEFSYNVYGEVHPYNATISNNIGIIFKNMHDYDSSLYYYRKSLDLYKRCYDDPYHLLSTNYNISLIYFDQGKYDEALKYLNIILELQQNIDKKNNIILKKVYSAIGEIYYHKKNYKQAIHFFQKAFFYNSHNYNDSIDLFNTPTFDNYSNASSLLNFIYYKAKCFERIAESDEPITGFETIPKSELYKAALQHYLFCDSLVSSLRVLSNYNSEKLELSKSASPIYNDAIELCYQLAAKSNDISEREEYLEKAFHFSQKTKANVLEEGITVANARGFAGIPDSLIQKENSLKVEIAYLNRKIAESTDSTLIQEYQGKLFDANRQFESLVNLFETTYPKFYSLKYEQKNYSVKELQSLLDKNTALVDYYTTDSLLYTFVLTRDSFNLIKTRNQGVDSLINAFRTSIYAYSGNKDFERHGLQNFLESGHALYKLTVKPIEGYLKGKNKITITSTGMMSLLPFEAMISSYSKEGTPKLKDLDYLVKKYEFSYHYSAGLWANSVKKSNQMAGLRDRIMCFAPVFESTEREIKKDTTENKGYSIDDNGLCSVSGASLSPLPATEKAVAEIIKIAASNGKAAEKFVLNDASKEKFKALANKNRYVLVATHGMANDQIPDLSGLFFAKQASDNENSSDNFLSSGEIYNMELNTDLLVLYACETGTGKVIAGEGVMALTRAFVYAGASNIIQSLWSISDASTKDLVVYFFNELYKGKSYSESLRLAKLKMIDYGVTPFHWSGMVLLGN